MKKAITLFLLIAAVTLTLCACGGSKSTSTHACAGKWTCKDIPEDMQVYKALTVEITDDSFTYTMTGDKTAKVVEGTAKTTGSQSMVLYMNSMKEVDNATESVVRERKAQASSTDEEPVYVQLSKDGSLMLNNKAITITFVRDA